MGVVGPEADEHSVTAQIAKRPGAANRSVCAVTLPAESAGQQAVAGCQVPTVARATRTGHHGSLRPRCSALRWAAARSRSLW